MSIAKAKFAARLRRKRSIRKKISGTNELPRLSFYKSSRQLSVQAIDDVNGRTLFAASVRSGTNEAAAKELAVQLAAAAQLKEQRCFKFDRNGNAYHGVIKAFCSDLRANGFKL